MSKHGSTAPVSHRRPSQWGFRERLFVAVLMAIIVGLVGAFTGAFGTGIANAAGSAIGYHAVTNSKIAPDAVSKSKIRSEAVGASEIVEGSVTWGNLAQSTKDQITALSASGKYTKFEVRNDGDLYGIKSDGTADDLGHVAGNDGKDAPQPVAVTAQTQLINRDDGGHSGTWAQDNMLRVLAIQRHGQVDVSHCGGTEADNCWFYTATISDSGSFTTVNGAKSPRQGSAISGTVSGTVTGNGRYEFYSTDGGPNAGAVPPTEDGNVHGSASWPALAFEDGSVFNVSEHKYAYVYNAPATCETWTETSANHDGTDSDAGDITGVNAC